MGQRAEALAARIEQGADALVAFAQTLSPAEWNTRVPKDGRTVGVIIHHVGNMYPIEVQLAQTLADGKPIAGVTWDAVHQINAEHATANAAIDKAAAIEFVQSRSRAAAAAVRAIPDDKLDNASTVSLNADAPLTCQFFIEDHALRHSFHHLAKIRAAVGR